MSNKRNAKEDSKELKNDSGNMLSETIYQADRIRRAAGFVDDDSSDKQDCDDKVCIERSKKEG